MNTAYALRRTPAAEPLTLDDAGLEVLAERFPPELRQLVKDARQFLDACPDGSIGFAYFYAIVPAAEGAIARADIAAPADECRCTAGDLGVTNSSQCPRHREPAAPREPCPVDATMAEPLPGPLSAEVMREIADIRDRRGDRDMRTLARAILLLGATPPNGAAMRSGQ